MSTVLEPLKKTKEVVKLPWLLKEFVHFSEASLLHLESLNSEKAKANLGLTTNREKIFKQPRRFLSSINIAALNAITIHCSSRHSLPHRLWVFSLTAFHLQQGFSEDAAGHTDGLTDVIPRVFNLDVCDGQLTAQWHRETARLWRLLDWEQQDLKEKNVVRIRL